MIVYIVLHVHLYTSSHLGHSNSISCFSGPTDPKKIALQKKKQFQTIRKIRSGIKMNGKFTWPSVAVYRGQVVHFNSRKSGRRFCN